MNLYNLNTILEEQRKICDLIEQMIKNEENKKIEKFITSAELANVFNVERGCISHWIKKKIIKNYKQERKKCKVEIPYSEIERLIKGSLNKYNNAWNNYTNKVN